MKTMILAHLLSMTALVAGQTSTVILPPSIDPFYVPPMGYATTAPGSILRIRVAAGNLSSLYNASAAYQILYRTTDSRYKATTSVTTLFVPQVANGSKFLSFQIPYDSVDVDASPSYTLYQGGVSDITAGLKKGWYVASPDYEGPLASFTAGVISGHSTLDGVRAVLNAGMGLTANTTYALSGYSGGALASEWAAELQVQYAPELNFAGAALGGLTPNVSSVQQDIDGTLEAGLIVSGTLGLASQYPEYSVMLDSLLKKNGTYNATTFYSARNLTLVGSIVQFANQNISDYFIDGALAFMTPYALQVIHNDGVMGYHGTPQMPVFAYKAIGDELSPVADTDNLINRYCGVGANIVYNRNTIGSHTTEQGNGDPRAMQFISDVLNGGYSHTGCTILNVTNSGNSTKYL